MSILVAHRPTPDVTWGTAEQAPATRVEPAEVYLPASPEAFRPARRVTMDVHRVQEYLIGGW